MRLPKPIKLDMEKGIPIMEDGVPDFLELRRLCGAEQSLHAIWQVHCCDCGLGHIYDGEVLARGKKWYLVLRTYRIEGSGKEKAK